MNHYSQALIFKKQKNSAAVILAILLFSIYFFTLDGHFFTVDEAHHYRMAQSIIHQGTLDIGVLPDAELSKNNDYQSKKGIGFALLTVPIHLLGDWIKDFIPLHHRIKTHGFPLGSGRFLGGTYEIFVASFANIFITILLCELCFFIALYFSLSVPVAFLYSVFIGVATAFFAYSQTYLEHTLASLCLLGSCFFIIKAKSEDKFYFLLYAGIATALGILTRIEFVLSVPVLLTYLVFQESKAINFSQILWRFIFPFSSFFLFAIFIYLGINFYRYGEFWRFSSINLSYFDGNLLEGLHGHLLSYGRSIFLFSPPIILSCFFWPTFLRKFRAEAILFLTLIFVYLIFYSKYRFWDGSWCYGNRYMLIVLPLISFPLVFAIQRAFQKKNRILFLALFFSFLAGIFVQFLGLSVYLGSVFTEWTKMNLLGGNAYLYQWANSPLVMHWQKLFQTDFFNFWCFFLYKFYGQKVTLQIFLVPALLFLIAILKIPSLFCRSREVASQ